MTSSKPCRVKLAARILSRFGHSSAVFVSVALVLTGGAQAFAQNEFRADASIEEPIPAAPPPLRRSNEPIASMPPPLTPPPQRQAVRGRSPAVMPSALLAAQDVPPAPPPLSTAQQKAIAKIADNKSSGKAGDKTHQVLPLITFFNSVDGEVYNWWAERKSQKQMSSLSKKVMGDLTRAKHKAFRYGVSAEAVRAMPEEFKKTALSAEELTRMGEALGAKIVVSGDVTFSKSPLIASGWRMKVRASASDVATGTVIAEVLRISDLHKSDYERLFFADTAMRIDAFTELNDQMEKLAPATQPRLVKLLVSGKLSHGDLELLKQKIRAQVPGVRGIRHGAFENEQVALLIDMPGANPERLGRALSQVQFGSFLTQVVSSDANQVLFDVKVRRQ